MKNNIDIFKKAWFEYAAIFFLTTSLLFIYLSPYWSFEDSARSASLIRIMLFLTNILLVSHFLMQGRTAKQYRIKTIPLNCLLTVLFLYLFANSFLLSEDLKPVRRLLMYVFLFLPFLIIKLKTQFVRKIVMFIAVVSATLAAYSLVNQYLQGGLPTGYRLGEELISSGTDGVASFGNTIVAAMHYAIGFTLLTYLFFTESKTLLLWAWSILLAFVALYIALTFARSAWVTCLVGALVIYALTFNKNRIRFYIVPILLLLVSLYFVMNFIDYEFGERGLTYRDEIWMNVISQIKGHWVFGYGLSTPFDIISTQDGKVLVHNSHNLYLEIIYQTGLVGLLLYLVTFFAAIYTLFKAYILKVYSDLSVLFLALLISISVTMLIEMNSWIHSPNLLWMWLWVPVAIALSFERKLNDIATD